MDLNKIALEKDSHDDLKKFKSKFLNNSNEIYLDGKVWSFLDKRDPIAFL